MERVIYIVQKVFNAIFVQLPSSSRGAYYYIIQHFTSSIASPLLLWGVIFLIIGFVVGVIKRIIKS